MCLIYKFLYLVLTSYVCLFTSSYWILLLVHFSVKKKIFMETNRLGSKRFGVLEYYPLKHLKIPQGTRELSNYTSSFYWLISSPFFFIFLLQYFPDKAISFAPRSFRANYFVFVILVKLFKSITILYCGVNACVT